MNINDIMQKAEGLVGKEKIAQAKEFIESDKGKEMLETAKEKIQGFVSEKITHKK